MKMDGLRPKCLGTENEKPERSLRRNSQGGRNIT